jgi:hypothetical protein
MGECEWVSEWVRGKEREKRRETPCVYFVTSIAMLYSQEIDYHATLCETHVFVYASCMHACVYVQTGRKHAAFSETVHDRIRIYLCMHVAHIIYIEIYTYIYIYIYTYAHIIYIYIYIYIYTYTWPSCFFSGTRRKISTLNIEVERVAAVTGCKHTLTTDSDSDALIAEIFLYMLAYMYMHVSHVYSSCILKESSLCAARWSAHTRAKFTMLVIYYYIYMYIYIHMHVFWACVKTHGVYIYIYIYMHIYAYIDTHTYIIHT